MINTKSPGSGPRPCSGVAPGLDDTVFLLNCYDVWSATPPGPLPCRFGAASPGETGPEMPPD